MKKFNFIRDGETCELPPGFRFQPTDEEIVFQYLARKIFSCPLPASVIPEFDVFAFHPSSLPGDSDRDRYFFTNRELNIRNVMNRSSRGSGSDGFWKVTGSDKRIVCSKRMPIVGIRRTLVLYKGKHPCAVRTDWFMHVYCIALSGNAGCIIHHKRHSQSGMIQVGKWVLCHVFMKKRSVRDLDDEVCSINGRLQQSYDHLLTAEMSDADSCSSSSDSDSSVLSEILPDGRIIIVGGRAQFNYEFYPGNSKSIRLNFLRETKDGYENNLYPFLHLLPDGNLFIFANKRSIVFDYNQDRVVREFPPIPGGDSRNYPSSGSSVLLPIDENTIPVTPEVMICGGASHNAFQLASKGTFLRASKTCGRLRITHDDQANWKMEKMPMARVMSDMLLLPTGDVIIINGAGSGSAGWEAARNPVTTPHIYKPNRTHKRFLIMTASPRPRMYHSSALLLTDGRVLVGGSNPHIYYNFTGVDFPTDLSLESFSPPYLSRQYDPLRPKILKIHGAVSYNKTFSVTFGVAELVEAGAVSVRIMAAPFNTHSFSMNQRMVVLRGIEVSCVASEIYKLGALGPSTLQIAPPGYYILFIVHADVPSSGMWVQIR
ncbi:glyoxal oxidase-related protein [Perilla frutescens var. hirtella]|uniref:Glyoxal oxidase-related protein n=1 Tax=Perilla frutescens var. hirtella TaxID=608512 RepID=A0AAD4JCZ3_PERFH|nr:glyoxal oxidase-related protein [Perilla frutescens var. hirtella]